LPGEDGSVAGPMSAGTVLQKKQAKSDRFLRISNIVDWFTRVIEDDNVTPISRLSLSFSNNSSEKQ
jgi:hypothetical protein